MTPKFRDNFLVINCVPLTEDTLPQVPLAMFTIKGQCRCSRCDIKATHVATYYEKSDPLRQIVTNLFCQLPSGGMRMMTTDHILPRNLGGTNFPTNKQPMCSHCNMRKGHFITDQELELVKSDPTRYLHLDPRKGRITRRKWKNLFTVAPDLKPVLETIVARYA